MPARRDVQISKHFRLGDFLIDETFPELAQELDPSEVHLGNLRRLCAVLDRIVDAFPPSLAILSGYRDAKLNEACMKAGLPASVNSLHLSGCAADVKPTGADVDLEVVYEWLSARSTELQLHEAVYYPLKGFLHLAVSDPENPTAKRMLMRT